MRIKRRFFLRGNCFSVMLLFITGINIVFFFHVKNSTHFLLKKVNSLSKEVFLEERNLSIKQAEFNKKYNIQKLQELSKNKLKLHFSSVEQITDFEEILKKK